jgi:hypothetical protein
MKTMTMREIVKTHRELWAEDRSYRILLMATAVSTIISVIMGTSWATR